MRIINLSPKGTTKQRERREATGQILALSDSIKKEGLTPLTTIYTFSTKSLIAVTYL